MRVCMRAWMCVYASAQACVQAFVECLSASMLHKCAMCI